MDDKKASPSLIARLTREWESFIRTAILSGFNTPTLFSAEYDIMDMVAHDWIITRNECGAGFWDGNWDKDMGEMLTQLCKQQGQFEVYESRGYVYPYNSVNINKLATYCFVKWDKFEPKNYKNGPSEYMIKIPEIDNHWRRIHSSVFSDVCVDVVYIKKERIYLGDILNVICVRDEAVRVEIR